MAARPRRTERGKAFELPCRYADRVCDRKLELESILKQHSDDVCLLIVTFLKPEHTFGLANYVCHRKDRLTAGGSTGILVHHSLPVPGMNHLEATAIQFVLAGRQA